MAAPLTSANPTHSALRWLAVPAAFALFVLVGLAISTEGRDTFEDRQEAGESRSNGQDGEFDGGSFTNDNGEPFDSQVEFEPDGDEEGKLVDFEVDSDNGRVGVEITEDGTIVTPASGSEPQLLPPDPSGQANGFRLNESGEFEPVEPGDIQPGDLVIDPGSRGVSVVRPDGSRIEIGRPLGAGGPLETSQIDPNGVRAPADVNSQGEIDLGDGVTIQLPEGDISRPPPSLWEQATTTPWRWVFLAIVVLAVASAAWAFYLNRNGNDEPFGADFVGPDGIPEDRFAEFLAMLSADPDPARAIHLAFSAAERGMGHLPTRSDTETPGEWNERVAADRPDLAQPLGALCDWFSTVRFADVAPNGDDRDAAVEALRELHRRAHSAPAGSAADGPIGVHA